MKLIEKYVKSCDNHDKERNTCTVMQDMVLVLVGCLEYFNHTSKFNCVKFVYALPCDIHITSIRAIYYYLTPKLKFLRNCTSEYAALLENVSFCSGPT